ncbi:MAG: hypothetical protein HQM03_06910 [Magnetococcales bacterium]|nr:hypothetical protein [Magnetococcales bacterium]
MPIIVFGLIAMALGIWGLSTWWWSFVELLRGLIPFLAILLGLVALGAGVTKMRHTVPSEPTDSELTEDGSQPKE